MSQSQRFHAAFISTKIYLPHLCTTETTDCAKLVQVFYVPTEEMALRSPRGGLPAAQEVRSHLVSKDGHLELIKI